MSRVPQSTQKVRPCRRATACRESSQCVAGRPAFTRPPHSGQWLTGASRRRWFMFSQAVPERCPGNPRPPRSSRTGSRSCRASSGRGSPRRPWPARTSDGVAPARGLRPAQPRRPGSPTPVFANTRGAPIEPNSLLPHWYAAQRALGVRVRGLYSTKDTFVTTALDAGVKIAWLETQTGSTTSRSGATTGSGCRATAGASWSGSRRSTRRSSVGRVCRTESQLCRVLSEVSGRLGKKKCERGDLNPARLVKSLGFLGTWTPENPLGPPGLSPAGTWVLY